MVNGNKNRERGMRIGNDGCRNNSSTIFCSVPQFLCRICLNLGNRLVSSFFQESFNSGKQEKVARSKVS